MNELLYVINLVPESYHNKAYSQYQRKYSSLTCSTTVTITSVSFRQRARWCECARVCSYFLTLFYVVVVNVIDIVIKLPKFYCICYKLVVLIFLFSIGQVIHQPLQIKSGRFNPQKRHGPLTAHVETITNKEKKQLC